PNFAPGSPNLLYLARVEETEHQSAVSERGQWMLDEVDSDVWGADVLAERARDDGPVAAKEAVVLGPLVAEQVGEHRTKPSLVGARVHATRALDGDHGRERLAEASRRCIVRWY